MLVDLNKAAPFLDAGAPEYFVSGIQRIDLMTGGVQRYVFYAEDFSIEGQIAHRRVCDLIVPAANVPLCIQQAAASLVLIGVKTLVRPLAALAH